MKLRDWRMRLQRGWAKFWSWFRDNFIILTAMLLFLGLLVVWLMFRQGLLSVYELQAYAMYWAAMGTGLLAVATVFMARKNSQLTELTRLSLEKPVIGEIIVYAIEPVEKRIEQDADVIQGEGVCLYDIPLSHLPSHLIPHTLYDIKALFLRDIFVHYPHYMELIRRYPDFENYLADYGNSISKARKLIEQALQDIETRLRASSLAKIVATFPANSKIPLKYLPFWELLSTLERVVPRLDYDRYHLWSSEVDSFWQNHKEEIMTLIHTTSIPYLNLITDINSTIKECEEILERKYERLKKVKGELKAKYLFTEEELKSLRARYQQEREGARLV